MSVTHYPLTSAAVSTQRKGPLNDFEKRELSRLLAGQMDFIDDPSFHERGALKKLFREPPALPEPNSSWYHPAMDRLDAKAAVVENKVLKADQEQLIFLQFNYARYRAAELHKKATRRSLTPRQARELFDWVALAQNLQDRIAQFNLALVLAMVRRINTKADYSDLISEGNLVLLHAINKFDVSRGFKFSTYACRSILRALGRVGEKHSKHRNLFPVAFEESREQTESDSFEEQLDTSDGLAKLRVVIDTNAAHLTPLEETIIKHRFPMEGSSSKWLTLRDLGKVIGYTKERTRQLQARALEKLRVAMEAPLPG